VWVRLPPSPLDGTTGYANRNSGQVESLMFVGSTPTLVTAEWTGVGSQRGLISRPTPVRIRPPQLDRPVVEREDAPLIRGRAVVRSHPGLLMGAHVPRVASLSCKQTAVGSIPTVSTDDGR
jgi:membrane peptidoglycan carboxypeptidase